MLFIHIADGGTAIMSTMAGIEDDGVKGYGGASEQGQDEATQQRPTKCGEERSGEAGKRSA
jgi:hypothetical protein